MYWFEKSDDEHVGYIYHYFDYRPLNNTIEIKDKYVLTHDEFVTWYEQNKSL